MIQGLYAAANGMMSVEDRQAVIANNIANSLTPGFKRQTPVQQGYYEVFLGETSSANRYNHETAPGGGAKIIATHTDFSNGIVSTTGNSLDAALIGPGFFVVDTPEGERFTRNGKFSVGQDGQLVTNHGFTVLGVGNAPIEVNGGAVEFDGDGQVLVNGEVRGQLRVVEFDDPQQLNRSGLSLLRASDAVLEQSAPAANTTVAGGALELANVQVPLEVSNMLLALRAYGANQKVITSIDETVSRLIDQVGAP